MSQAKQRRKHRLRNIRSHRPHWFNVLTSSRSPAAWPMSAPPLAGIMGGPASFATASRKDDAVSKSAAPTRHPLAWKASTNGPPTIPGCSQHAQKMQHRQYGTEETRKLASSVSASEPGSRIIHSAYHPRQNSELSGVAAGRHRPARDPIDFRRHPVERKRGQLAYRFVNLETTITGKYLSILRQMSSQNL